MEKTIQKIILLAIILAPCSSIFVFKTGYIDLKILQIIWSVIFALILIQKASVKCITVTSDTNNKVIFALYLLILVISCLFSIDMVISVKELFQYIYLFLMMIVIYKNARNDDFLNKIINAIIISNVLLVSVSLISYISGKALIPAFQMYPSGHIYVLDRIYNSQALVESQNVINRISGILGLGTLSIANLVLIQSLFVNYKIRSSKGRDKQLYLVLFLANIIVLCLTYSRSALLIFIAVHFITLLSKDKKVNFLLIIIAIFSIPFILSLFPNLYERILEAFNPQEGSTKTHFVYWLIALQEGYDYILTGIGLGNSALHHDAYPQLFSQFGLYKSNGVDIHNFLLQIWAEQGIFGILINAILLFSPIMHFIKVRYIRKSMQRNTVFSFIILAYIATLALNLTNNNFYIETFWALAALAYACKDIYPDNYKISNNNLMNGGTAVTKELKNKLILEQPSL